MKHYSKEELEMYRNRELGVWNQMVCKAHLKKCVECRASLQNLDKEDTLLRTLKKSVRLFNELAEIRLKNGK